MTHDLLDVFMARFPHLATRATEAAEDIAEAEVLLDDATAIGLPHTRFAWLALREVQIDIDERHAAAWLNFLASRGFRSMAASSKTGKVSLHLVQPGKVSLHLVQPGSTVAEARRIFLQMPQPQQVPV